MSLLSARTTSSPESRGPLASWMMSRYADNACTMHLIPIAQAGVPRTAFQNYVIFWFEDRHVFLYVEPQEKNGPQ